MAKHHPFPATLSRIIVFLLIITLIVPVFGLPIFRWPVFAQETMQDVTTPSGRLSLQVPADWLILDMPEEEEIQGLDSETLVITTSQKDLQAFTELSNFNGAVIFLSAYPHNVYADEEILSDPIKMLTEVTVFDEEDLMPFTLTPYPGAEFYYAESGFIFRDILFDTGELSYRVSAYLMEEHQEAVERMLASFSENPVSTEFAFEASLPNRKIHLSDLYVMLPSNWLYWNDSSTTLTFASGARAYEDLSYALKPESASEVAFIIYRLSRSGLRPGEVVDGQPDLNRIMQRIREESGGLSKETPPDTITIEGDLSGIESLWLVPGTTSTSLTRTRIFDGGNFIYIVQAQYAGVYQASVDALFDSMVFAGTTARFPLTEGLEAGQLAPDFTLPLLNGGEARLSDYQGKLILVNLWASWCGPCHEEAPHLQAAYKDYGGQFEILGVDVGESRYEAHNFVMQYGLSFPILLDDDSQVAELYQLRGYPTTYIVGHDGVILDVVVGSFTEDGLYDVLQLYLGAPESEER